VGPLDEAACGKLSGSVSGFPLLSKKLSRACAGEALVLTSVIVVSQVPADSIRAIEPVPVNAVTPAAAPCSTV